VFIANVPNTHGTVTIPFASQLRAGTLHYYVTRLAAKSHLPSSPLDLLF
jgi:hypothetical protein